MIIFRILLPKIIINTLNFHVKIGEYGNLSQKPAKLWIFTQKNKLFLSGNFEVFIYLLHFSREEKYLGICHIRNYFFAQKIENGQK